MGENSNVFVDYDSHSNEGSIVKERQKRLAPAIPLALWGIRVAPSMIRALITAYGLVAVLESGIDVADKVSDQTRRKSE